MKQTILQFIFFLVAVVLALPAHAQITIDEADFPRQAVFLDSVIRSTPAVQVLPTEGPDQNWDYSNLVKDELIEIEYYDADNYEFPEALNVRIADLSFQGFLIEADAYDGLDNEGWYPFGRSTFEVEYSITAITGGPDDILFFPEVNDIYSGRVNFLNFPVNYEDQWSQSRVETIPFELTVAAFGLNETPGERQRTVSNDRSVVGYGDLILPNEDGNPTAPMEVLLLKVTETSLDSVFLGGAPAPEALLNAFGLVQGSSVSDTRYLFYKKDFGAPVFSMEIEDDIVFYRPQAEATISRTNEIQLANINYFPNPATAGEVINLVTEFPIGPGSIQLYDAMGRLTFEEKLNTGFANEIQLHLPATLDAGMQFYHVKNDKGIIVGIGKIVLE